MAGTYDKVTRVEKGMDAGAPDTESLTERVEGRSAELQAIRGTNQELQAEVVQLESAVGVDPEAPTESVKEHESTVKRDFNTVAKIFGDLIQRLESEGRSKEAIDHARKEFAKAASLYAMQSQEKGQRSPSVVSDWERQANRAIGALPSLAHETISWDAPDAKKLDVPAGDRRYIDQIRTTHMDLDGEEYNLVFAGLHDDAPADVQKRFFVAGRKEDMQKMLSRRTQTTEQFREYRNLAAEAAALSGVDLIATERALLKADAMFAESQKAVDEAERIYKQQILEMRVLSDAQVTDNHSLSDIFKRNKTDEARKRLLDAENAAFAAVDAFKDRLPKAIAA